MSHHLLGPFRYARSLPICPSMPPEFIPGHWDDTAGCDASAGNVDTQPRYCVLRQIDKPSAVRLRDLWTAGHDPVVQIDVSPLNLGQLTLWPPYSNTDTT